MNTTGFHEFRQSLNDSAVRTLQIVHAAIGMGATLFLAVVLFLYYRGLPSGPETAQTAPDLMTMTLIHGVMLAVCVWLSGFLYSRAFAEKQVRAYAGNGGSGEGTPRLGPGDILMIIKNARIIKLAVLEGPAFFGLAICFMGVTGGAIYREPYYWINLASYGILALTVYRDFPTKDKLLSEAKAKLGYLFV